MWRLRRKTTMLLAVICLSCAGCWHSERLVVVTGTDEVLFVQPGETYRNNGTHTKAVISKQALIELMEAAGDSLLED